MNKITAVIIEDEIPAARRLNTSRMASHDIARQCRKKCRMV